MAQDNDEDTYKEMSFLDHLEESRKAIISSVICLLLGVTVIIYFLEPIANALARPYHTALGNDGPALEGLEGLTTTGPFGVFTVIFQVSFIGGAIIALPAILFFVAKFVSPALTAREKKVIVPICISSFILFVMGACFSYFLILPASLKASMFFNDLLGFETIWRADSYYGLLMWMVLGIGLSFEFPMVLVALVYVGVFNTKQLKKFRPYSFIVFLIVSAIITPTPDPFTFLLLAGPMAILYEIAMLVAVYFEKKQIKRKREFMEENGYTDDDDDDDTDGGDDKNDDVKGAITEETRNDSLENNDYDEVDDFYDDDYDEDHDIYNDDDYIKDNEKDEEKENGEDDGEDNGKDKDDNTGDDKK